MYNTLVFDLDGTLVDSIEDLALSTNILMKENHFPTYDLDTYKQFVGNGVDKLIEVPVIPNLVFIHTTLKTCMSLIQEYAFDMRYLRDRETGNFLIVPDKQMNDFMFLLDFSKEMVEVVNENLKKGDKVRVIKGDFAGIEGELIRVKGHKRVVVRLEGVVSLATAYIPSSFLEKIE